MTSPRIARRFGSSGLRQRVKTRLKRGAEDAPAEDGFTLVELLVVMPFFFIVTTLVMTSMITGYRAESRVQQTSAASSQVITAFMSLDTDIRYASDIEVGKDSSTPVNYYIVFDSDWNTNASGEPACTEIEYNNSSGQLQQRNWYSTLTAPTGWQVLATSLQTSVSTDPFTLSDADVPWSVSVKLNSVANAGNTKAGAQSSFSITALNTSLTSISSGVCGVTLQ